MNITEALQTQLDNMCRDFHKLQVENKKLREQNPKELEQLRDEVIEFRQ